MKHKEKFAKLPEIQQLKADMNQLNEDHSKKAKEIVVKKNHIEIKHQNSKELTYFSQTLSGSLLLPHLLDRPQKIRLPKRQT